RFYGGGDFPVSYENRRPAPARNVTDSRPTSDRTFVGARSSGQGNAAREDGERHMLRPSLTADWTRTHSGESRGPKRGQQMRSSLYDIIDAEFGRRGKSEIGVAPVRRRRGEQPP